MERLNGNGGCTVITGSGATCPAATQTTETEGIFTGYRFFDKEGITPQFPFGYGLSYTTFGFSDLSTAQASDGGVDVTFTVKNTGDMAGAEHDILAAIRLDPFFVPAYVNLADVYRTRGRDADGVHRRQRRDRHDLVAALLQRLHDVARHVRLEEVRERFTRSVSEPLPLSTVNSIDRLAP